MPDATGFGRASLGSICVILTMAAVGIAQPATRPAATVLGRVSAEGDVPLAEMVVYLESQDASQRLPAPPPPVHVSQKGAQFEPRLLVVSVGQTVEFPNDEDRPIEHNVFSDSPPMRFDLGLYKPGESRRITFDKPGPVFLYCSIHRNMDAVIFVAPTTLSSRVSASGDYIIPNVPPGRWMVRTWQRRRRFPEQAFAVNVDPDRPTVINLELKRK
jgi:plastocyanin